MLKFIIIIIIIIRTLIALIRSGKQNVISDGLPLLFLIFCFYLFLFFFFFLAFCFFPCSRNITFNSESKNKVHKGGAICEALWENSWGFLKKKKQLEEEEDKVKKKKEKERRDTTNFVPFW